MIYEFECPHCKAVEEANVRMGTYSILCPRCAEINIDQPMRRILSPTRTTFKFADTKLKA